MTAQLYEIDAAKVNVNQPLQWDVYSAQGTLLLHKGSVILSEGQRERLLELGMYVDTAAVQSTSTRRAAPTIRFSNGTTCAAGWAA